MNSITTDFTGTKLDNATVKTKFEKNAAPMPRKPDAPLLFGRTPPRHGYWKDPNTGQEFSGGMEIAPTTPAK
jgi:hypothetical protein